ncbi:hypothetical protein [Cellulomonas palmilytica]|uniref:hypothetical protein n=1 Tax=Cellulomonas palmilytica TaxID=2608402 RepID=UPI001F1EA9AD|nr:hypothetical protein [Cellulomonas palmilytica]UJP40446.1 hypothetical protein F1D97_02655 [Cellulomonas palmilytica]
MSEPTTTPAASTAEDRAIDALTRILDSAISPQMLEAQQLILRRLATAGDLFPSRVPAPLNITQVGGYLNLIQDDAVMRAQVLASTLGVAGPNPTPGFDPVLPPLYLTARVNDRPAGGAQAAIPVSVQVRSDLAAAFDAVRAALHAQGATLPVLSAVRPLPPAGIGVPAPDDLLPYLGRVLELVPSTALVDPATDALALGQEGGAGPQTLVARVLDPAAPDAGSVPEAAWSLWDCDATACTQVTVTGRFVRLAPVLEGAGWYAPPPGAPTSSSDAGAWYRFTNTTGLVAGVSRFGDELALMWSAGQIAASSVREKVAAVWDGTAFVEA